jgi:NADPH-dependent 2,4-dienoyl-CoA reductase/sulfur reductase-like enzyme
VAGDSDGIFEIFGSYVPFPNHVHPISERWDNHRAATIFISAGVCSSSTLDLVEDGLNTRQSLPQHTRLQLMNLVCVLSAMISDLLRVFGKALKYFLPFSIQLLRQKLEAIIHRWTYKQVKSPKNVLVIGGSFAGLQLATRLGHTLPTGYRVILIEKNSHFNFSFNFPRYSVLRGHESRAFIPYDASGNDCPPGIFKITQGIVTSVEEDFVQLDTGERISYSYLAIASGSSQPLPAKVTSSNKAEACEELRSVQESIKAAKTIAIIGGGAVGVEIATDIKSYYPEKQVTIVHSRQQLLPRFGSRLHDYVSEKIVKMGIYLQLGERPHLLYEKGSSQGLITDGTLFFSTGEQHFDLIVQPSP